MLPMKRAVVVVVAALGLSAGVVAFNASMAGSRLDAIDIAAYTRKEQAPRECRAKLIWAKRSLESSLRQRKRHEALTGKSEPDTPEVRRRVERDLGAECLEKLRRAWEALAEKALKEGALPRQ
jgi:hypothetical protein